MGVKHFYYWYSRQWKECVTRLDQRHLEQNPRIDTLCLDMNGLFHQSAQQVFEYGNCAPEPPVASLLGRSVVPKPRMKLTPNKMLLLNRSIVAKVEELLRLVRPGKALVMCVDGVAGLGKMNQQRQRRFRSVWDADAQCMQSKVLCPSAEFHPNTLTPGTRLMDELTRYLDWYIRWKQTTDPVWQALDVVFSNEKVAGEGEHKLMHYLRNHALKTDVACIYGLDADLVMLGMMLPLDQVYILREMQEGLKEWIDVQRFQNCIEQWMRWDTSAPAPSKGGVKPLFCKKRAVTDFVLLCFMVGNDFLPTIPSLAIIDGAVEVMMDLYRTVGREHGHLTTTTRSRVDGQTMCRLRPKALACFFRELAKQEANIIVRKYQHMDRFTPDPLVLRFLNQRGLDWDNFRQSYYQEHFPEPRGRVAHKYIDGMVWVLNYYSQGMPDWTWYFPYLYGPFAADMVDTMESYRHPHFNLHQPVRPFVQLTMVLPPCHQSLLPTAFHPLFQEHPRLRYAFPDTLRLDMSGKRKDWEAIVTLPPLRLEDFLREHDAVIRHVPDKEAKRNREGQTFLYRHDGARRYSFASVHGRLASCSSAVKVIQLA